MIKRGIINEWASEPDKPEPGIGLLSLLVLRRHMDGRYGGDEGVERVRDRENERGRVQGGR